MHRSVLLCAGQNGRNGSQMKLKRIVCRARAVYRQAFNFATTTWFLCRAAAELARDGFRQIYPTTTSAALSG